PGRRAIPVLMIHGMKDQHVPYNGGVPTKSLEKGRTDLSVAEGVKFWIANNGCDAQPRTENRTGGRVILQTYACSRGADVQLITLPEGGHSWPGARAPGRAVPYVDPPSRDLDATTTIWEFFEKHHRQ